MNIQFNIRKYIYFKTGLFLTYLYSFFRNCSGVTVKSKQRLEEYKESERQCYEMKAKLPILKIGVDELLEKNQELNELLDVVIDDMKRVNYYFGIGEYEIVRDILSFYDTKKIEE